jgi:hypothetical protein
MANLAGSTVRAGIPNEFLIEKMQPSWLPNPQLRITYRGQARLSSGLILGLIGGLIGLVGGLSAGLIGG